MQEITIKQAVATLSNALKEDSDYRQGWQANIAMSVFDRITDIKGYKSKQAIHNACNEGAFEFINKLTN